MFRQFINNNGYFIGVDLADRKGDLSVATIKIALQLLAKLVADEVVHLNLLKEQSKKNFCNNEK